MDQLPPPGIYGDPRVEKNPPADFGEPDPLRGTSPDPHAILKMALMRMLGK